MSILITGAAGFLGSHLVPLLLAKRAETVICLDNFNSEYSPQRKRANLAPYEFHPRVAIREGDIRDAELLEQLFAEHQVREVVHLAAHAGVRRSVARPLDYIDNNIRGTAVLLEQCRRQPLARVVLASSSTVYGPRAALPFAEDQPCGAPASPYGATKAAMELLARTYVDLHHSPIVCVRPFSAIGPRMRPDLALSRFASALLEDRALPLFGDGSHRRDYTHAADICLGIAAALTAPDVIGECINLGCETPLTTREMIRLLAIAFGRKAKIEQSPANPADLPSTCADLSKARRLLGYQPTITAAEAVNEFTNWFIQESAELRVFSDRIRAASYRPPEEVS